MDLKYIVALEIGSSKIKGVAAAVDTSAAIRILAVEEVAVSNTVRYGRVQNVQEVARDVEQIIRRLENNRNVAPRKVSGIYIAQGGRSLMSVPTEATLRLPAEVEITTEVLDRLRNEARYNLATEKDVLAIEPRRYYVDSSEVVDKVVGMFGNQLRGEFTAVVCSPDNRRNLDRLRFDSHPDLERQYVPRVLAQAEMLLSDSDRQVGCVLVDFGAETTTMAVYREGKLLLAIALPMGSRNITRDLATALSVTEDKAEQLKITHAEAVNERLGAEASDRDVREIINYASARASEIIANINNVLASRGFKPADLPAGIVITGGGSNLKGFGALLERQTKMRVRRAEVDRSIAMVDGQRADANTDVIALIRYALAHPMLKECLTDAPRVQQPQAQAAGRPAAAGTASPQPSVSYGGPQPFQPKAGGSGRSVTDQNWDKDDPDDEIIGGTVDEPIDDLPAGKTASETRNGLLTRIKDFFAPKYDNVDED